MTSTEPAAIRTETCVVRNTGARKGRHLSVTPQTTASRHLYYGRIVLDAGDAPVEAEELAADRMAFDLVSGPIDEVALFTDGIKFLVLHYATKTVHAPFFEKMFSPVRASKTEHVDEALSAGLERYLASPAVCERTDDDKTLILATRRAPPTPADPPRDDRAFADRGPRLERTDRSRKDARQGRRGRGLRTTGLAGSRGEASTTSRFRSRRPRKSRRWRR